MKLANRNLWQVGAGDTNRRYHKICLKWDVMMVGPGDPGPYEEHRYRDVGDIKNSVRRFYHEARRRDIVLLRIGTGQILAVGEIEDDKPTYMDEFGDIDGWDLQHVRRVRWFPNTERDFPVKTLGGQVRTFASVGVAQVREWVESLQIDEGPAKRPLTDLPSESDEMKTEALGKQLFIEGLPGEYIDNLTETLESIRRVATWYQNKEKKPEGRPSEQETLCYLVIPLLFSLGWSHQTAAIEWNRVDIALFKAMPSADKNLECVVETKLLSGSVFSPKGQAESYARQEGRQDCQRMIMTDGIRYSFYRRKRNEFLLKAYLNILRMRKAYPILGCEGAVEAIMGMAK